MFQNLRQNSTSFVINASNRVHRKYSIMRWRLEYNAPVLSHIHVITSAKLTNSSQKYCQISTAVAESRKCRPQWCKFTKHFCIFDSSDFYSRLLLCFKRGICCHICVCLSVRLSVLNDAVLCLKRRFPVENVSPSDRPNILVFRCKS